MKNAIRILSFILITSMAVTYSPIAKSQTVYKSTGSKGKKKRLKGEGGFDVHKMVVGGNVGFSGGQVDANTTYSFFEITPMVGYQLANFDYGGITLGYQYNRFKYNDFYNYVTGQSYTYKLKLPMYYVGIWNHLYVIPQIFINTELLYTTYKRADGTYDPDTGELERTTESAPSVIIGAGYANRQSPDQRVWYSFWINYDILQNPKSVNYSGNDFIAGLFYKVGFFFKL